MSNWPVFNTPLAGRWHSARLSSLNAELKELRPLSAPDVEEGVCAIVVPHAGYSYSGRTAAAVYARLNPGAYERIIVLAPSHYAAMRNRASAMPVCGFRTPLGTSPADQDWLKQFFELSHSTTLPEAHHQEHSDQIQIPLLQHFMGLEKKIATIVMGQFSNQARSDFARELRPLLDEHTLLVISTDFTHYGEQFGYAPFRNLSGEALGTAIGELDGKVFDSFASRDENAFQAVLEETGATVCGREPLALLLALLPVEAQIVKTGYTQSGEEMRDWSHSVSYLGALVRGSWDTAKSGAQALETDKLNSEDQAFLLKLAREAIAGVLQNQPGEKQGATKMPQISSPALQRKCGAFVTLTIDGQLRGCIGEIEPGRPLWQAVRGRAVDAALNDPRFYPLSVSEFAGVKIEISALTPPRPIGSWREIEVGRHGVILHKSGFSAVFLPQVAPEQGWDCKTMLRHLAMKAGLEANAWREGAELLVFEAQVFGEKG